MFKAVVQEAAALTSLALFVGMIAIWSQVLGNCNAYRVVAYPRRHGRPLMPQGPGMTPAE